MGTDERRQLSAQNLSLAPGSSHPGDSVGVCGWGKQSRRIGLDIQLGLEALHRPLVEADQSAAG